MLCRNREQGNNRHTHATVAEARQCWFGRPPTQTVVVQPIQIPVRMVSDRQLSYIRDMGGDTVHASKLTYDEASKYITQLIADRQAARRAPDPRLKILEGMLDMISDGYYATPPAERDRIAFVRISRPTRGRYINCFKVQTKHADKWKEAMIRWPSGSWSVYASGIIEAMFLVLADSQTARLRYSVEVQSCHHCNTELTDARSRHYLIGPVCEKKYNLQWAIDMVDDKNDGMSFEELVSRGMPTRVWQDKELANA